MARMGTPPPLEMFYTDFSALWYASGGKKAHLDLRWTMPRNGTSRRLWGAAIERRSALDRFR